MAENRSWWSDGSGWKIKSNLAWQEIEADDMMEVDEVADWSKRLDDLVTKHLARTSTQFEKFKKWNSQLVPKRSLI